MKVDQAKLVHCIEQCFDLAGTEGVSEEDQEKFSQLGSALRDRMIQLLGRDFASDLNSQVISANVELQQVNQQLARTIQELDDFADTIGHVGQLIASLDGLITAIAPLV
jgi:hypothetical protein